MNFQRGSEMLPGNPMDLKTRYFQIIVILKDKSVHQGVRTNQHNEVDSMYILCRNKAYENYGQSNVIYFQCVQLSLYSDEAKDYEIKKAANLKVKYIRRYDEDQ